MMPSTGSRRIARRRDTHGVLPEAPIVVPAGLAGNSVLGAAVAIGRHRPKKPVFEPPPAEIVGYRD